MQRLRTPMGTRLTLVVAAPILIVVAIGWVLLSAAFERDAVKNLRVAGVGVLRQLTDSIELPVLNSDGAGVERSLRAVGASIQDLVSAVVSSPSGAVLALWRRDGDGTNDGHRSAELVSVDGVATHADRTVGRVRLLLSTRRLVSDASARSEIAIWILSAALGLVALLCLALSLGIERQVWRLTRIVRDAAKGNIGERAPERASELGELGASINAMIETFRQERELTLEARDRAIRSSRVAEEQHAEKARFMHNMAQEISDPVTVIVGFVEIIATKIQDPSVETPWLAQAGQAIDQSGRALVELTRGVRTWLQIQEGGARPVLTDVDLHETIAQLCDEAAKAAAERGVEWRVTLSPDLPRSAQSDPQWIQGVLQPVLRRALSEDCGASLVRIDARVQDDPAAQVVRIDVEDDGPTLSRRAAQELFVPFPGGLGRGRAQRSAEHLALAVARRWVVMMGGDLQILESKSQVGNRLRVVIPVSSEWALAKDAPAVRNPAVSEASAFADADLAGRRILYAGEDARSQRVLSLLLGTVGAQVTIVENSIAAVEESSRAQGGAAAFDVILLDLCEGDARAAEDLREAGYERAIVAIGDSNEVAESEDVNAWIAQPVNMKTLVETLAECIHRDKAL